MDTLPNQPTPEQAEEFLKGFDEDQMAKLQEAMQVEEQAQTRKKLHLDDPGFWSYVTPSNLSNPEHNGWRYLIAKAPTKKQDAILEVFFACYLSAVLQSPVNDYNLGVLSANTTNALFDYVNIVSVAAGLTVEHQRIEDYTKALTEEDVAEMLKVNPQASDPRELVDRSLKRIETVLDKRTALKGIVIGAYSNYLSELFNRVAEGNLFVTSIQRVLAETDKALADELFDKFGDNYLHYGLSLLMAMNTLFERQPDVDEGFANVLILDYNGIVVDGEQGPTIDFKTPEELGDDFNFKQYVSDEIMEYTQCFIAFVEAAVEFAQTGR